MNEDKLKNKIEEMVENLKLRQNSKYPLTPNEVKKYVLNQFNNEPLLDVRTEIETKDMYSYEKNYIDLSQKNTARLIIEYKETDISSDISNDKLNVYFDYYKTNGDTVYKDKAHLIKNDKIVNGYKIMEDIDLITKEQKFNKNQMIYLLNEDYEVPIRLLTQADKSIILDKDVENALITNLKKTAKNNCIKEKIPVYQAYERKINELPEIIKILGDMDKIKQEIYKFPELKEDLTKRKEELVSNIKNDVFLISKINSTKYNEFLNKFIEISNKSNGAFFKNQDKYNQLDLLFLVEQQSIEDSMSHIEFYFHDTLNKLKNEKNDLETNVKNTDNLFKEYIDPVIESIEMNKDKLSEHDLILYDDFNKALYSKDLDKIKTKLIDLCNAFEDKQTEYTYALFQIDGLKNELFKNVDKISNLQNEKIVLENKLNKSIFKRNTIKYGIQNTDKKINYLVSENNSKIKEIKNLEKTVESFKVYDRIFDALEYIKVDMKKDENIKQRDLKDIQVLENKINENTLVLNDFKSLKSDYIQLLVQNKDNLRDYLEITKSLYKDVGKSKDDLNITLNEINTTIDSKAENLNNMQNELKDINVDLNKIAEIAEINNENVKKELNINFIKKENKEIDKY